MASGISTQNGHVEDHGFWGELAVKLMHPTQLLIVESIWWIDEPLEVLEQVGEIPVRGASEKLFDLAGRSRARRA